jgi:hypothetical protein
MLIILIIIIVIYNINDMTILINNRYVNSKIMVYII